MKTIQFTLFIAVLGFFGIVNGASAQLIPAQGITLDEIQASKITNNTSPITDVIKNSGTIATHTQVANSTVVSTAIFSDDALTSPVNPHFKNIDQYQKANLAIDTTINVSPTHPTTPVDIQPVITPTPVTTQVVQVTSGQYTGGGLYGAPVVTQPYVAPKVVATYTAPAQPAKAPSAKVQPTKEIIPLLAEDEIISSRSVNESRNESRNAASVFGLGGGVSLIGILAVIAVMLGLMLAVKEYQARKRAEQYENRQYA